MSCTGIPSVIQAIKGIPASADSTIASAANGGGTKIRETFACCSLMACSTESNIGTSPSKSWPPFPGVTPATTLVP